MIAVSIAFKRVDFAPFFSLSMKDNEEVVAIVFGSCASG